MIEKLAVSELTTPDSSFEKDLAAYIEARIGGIGICERKLPRGGDLPLVAHFCATGLRATLALPEVSSILPTSDRSGPPDAADRIDAICSSVRRLGEFDPTAVICHTGPRGGRSEAEAREIVVSGLRKIARTAATARHREIVVGLEPAHPGLAAELSIASGLGEAIELAAEVDEPNVGIVLDTWHLGDSSDLLREIAEHAGRIVGVQVSDRPAAPRSACDRLLPGDGVLDLAAILGALEAAGYQGWYELEICSEESFADSLSKLAPAELARLGRERFLEVWKPQTALESPAW